MNESDKFTHPKPHSNSSKATTMANLDRIGDSAKFRACSTLSTWLRLSIRPSYSGRNRDR